jgi:hypothetical protein
MAWINDVFQKVLAPDRAIIVIPCVVAANLSLFFRDFRDLICFHPYGPSLTNT